MALEISNQYLYTGRGPFDAKSLVKTYAELLAESTWSSESGSIVAYNGMIVAVWLNTADPTKNGIYYLYDNTVTNAFKAPNVANEANWHKLAEVSDISDKLEAINDLADRVTTAESDIDAIEAAITAEVAARTEADSALVAKITEALDAAKAYADENDANTVYDDTTVRELISTNATAIAGFDERIAGKANAADVVANDTFEAFKTENSKAISDVETSVITEIESKGYAIDTDIQAKLDKKIETATIAHTSSTQGEEVKVEGTQLKIYLDAYTKSETLAKISEKITEINGGESAGEVLGELNSYKETNDLRVDIIEAKNSEQDTAIAALTAQYATTNENIIALIDTAEINTRKLAGIETTVTAYVDEAVAMVPVYKASTEISIADDGALGVNEVNVNKLVQTVGDTLILSGGTAKVLTAE